jgi:formate dehydrogenase subunit delta
MTLATQVRLANDIAAQFTYLRHDAAVEAVAAHLRMFWDPRMRAQLLEAVEAGVPGLDPLVLEAAAAL